jgi:hypothetical protein
MCINFGSPHSLPRRNKAVTCYNIRFVFLSPIIFDFILYFTESSFFLADAECGETKPLEFGYDIITSCRLEIGTEDFEDCDSMR